MAGEEGTNWSSKILNSIQSHHYLSPEMMLKISQQNSTLQNVRWLPHRNISLIFFFLTVQHSFISKKEGWYIQQQLSAKNRIPTRLWATPLHLLMNITLQLTISDRMSLQSSKILSISDSLAPPFKHFTIISASVSFKKWPFWSEDRIHWSPTAALLFQP